MAKNRILVVDDDEGIALFLKQSLHELAPEYDVQTARAAREALAAMSRQPFDLLVTDLRMPGIDGLELMRRVRERYPRMRLILITGYGDERVEAQAYQIGACRYFNKPFRVEELLTAIRQALAPARAPGRDALVLPDPQFDTVAERLSGLLFELGAQCILLADVSGQLIAQVGDIGSLNPSTLVSLVGGSFATSFELARYLRDADAVTLNYHEGTHYDIYAANISRDFFVVLLFDKQSQASRLGVAWLYLRRALGELQKLMGRASEVQGGRRTAPPAPESRSRATPSRAPQPQVPRPASEPLPSRSTPRPETLRPAPEPTPPPQAPRREARPERRDEAKNATPPPTGAPEKPPETFDLAQAIALGLLDPSWGQDAEDDTGET